MSEERYRGGGGGGGIIGGVELVGGGRNGTVGELDGGSISSTTSIVKAKPNQQIDTSSSSSSIFDIPLGNELSTSNILPSGFETLYQALDEHEQEFSHQQPSQSLLHPQQDTQQSVWQTTTENENENENEKRETERLVNELEEGGEKVEVKGGGMDWMGIEMGMGMGMGMGGEFGFGGEGELGGCEGE